jgi:hypothetical protein
MAHDASRPLEDSAGVQARHRGDIKRVRCPAPIADTAPCWVRRWLSITVSSARYGATLVLPVRQHARCAPLRARFAAQFA